MRSTVTHWTAMRAIGSRVSSATALKADVNLLYLGPGPGVLPEKGEARLDARVKKEAPDGHTLAQLPPAELIH